MARLAIAGAAGAFLLLTLGLTNCSSGAGTIDLFQGSVPCSTPSECPDQTPLCGGAGACVQCESDASCKSGEQCSSGLCVDCVGDADCDANEVCLAGECASSCSASADCIDGEANQCDTARNACVECVAAADCDGDRTCEVSAGRCVECVSDAECGGGVCLLNDCVECRADQDCGTGERCDVADGECRDFCQTDEDCPGDGRPACEPSSNRCVECAQNAHCGDSDKPLCNVTESECVECLADADCAEGTCRLDQGECQN